MKKIAAPAILAAACGLLATGQICAKPEVIAHRGASGYLPEHTLPAKAMAYAAGVDFIEQDVVLSKDNVPIVLHDEHLDTVTDVATVFPDRKRADGRYYALDFTLAELKKLRVTERFDRKTGQRVFPGRFPAGLSEFRLATFEEELQLIQGLNKSTGRNIGIYPEIKEPKWHRKQGRDVSRAVLDVLKRYGYQTKDDACWVQCFEYEEVLRIRNELGWGGRLLMLFSTKDKGSDGTDFVFLRSPAGLAKLAETVDGVGPDISAIVIWNKDGKATVSDLTKNAHEHKLVLHPYTIRIDALPKNCPSFDALHAALFRDAGVDGIFTDFGDVTVQWIKANMPASR